MSVLLLLRLNPYPCLFPAAYPVDRPYDPRPYDSRYARDRDYDDRRRRPERPDYDYRGGGRDYDRYRDDYRDSRDRGDRDRGYGRDRYDDRRH